MDIEGVAEEEPKLSGEQGVWGDEGSCRVQVLLGIVRRINILLEEKISQQLNWENKNLSVSLKITYM